MSSSPIPVLGPTLFYTPTDPYEVNTDNRPVYNLDSAAKTLAASLVGLGYGEHSAVQGGFLTPGKVVRLLENGMVRYPTAADINETDILFGMVIGSSAAGLNKIIWNSGFLDVNYLGMSSLFSGAVAGQYIEATFVDPSVTNFTLVTLPQNMNHVVGRVLSANGVISIGSQKALSNATDLDTVPAQTNYHNLLGFTRLRNLMLFTDLGKTPIQYSKTNIYQSSLGSSNNVINIFNAQLTSSGNIAAASPTSITYDSSALSWKIKEVFTRLFINNSDKISNSAWPDSVFSPTLTTLTGLGEVENFELQKVGSVGTDYSVSPNTDLYKQFKVIKYYQYTKVAPGSVTYGKPSVVATVFDPEGANKGGEPGKVIVWDFYTYDNSTGLELNQSRAVSTGTSATTLYDNTDIFPVALKAL